MKPEPTPKSSKNLIPIKQFCAEVGLKRKILGTSVYRAMARGQLPWPRLKRINQRVVFVKTSVQDYLKLNRKLTLKTLKQFCAEVSEASGINQHNVYMNMYRGHWPWPRLKRINQRVVLVRTKVKDYLNKLSENKL